MSAVDDYLAGVAPDRRSVLEHVRQVALETIPDAEEGLSYQIPCFKHRGKPVLGFLSAKRHLSLFPFSSRAIDALRPRLGAFDLARGTVRFTVANQVPDAIIRDLIAERLSEIRA